jgi:N-carbamoylputrescine amidase
MLHLAPELADVAHNRALAEQGLARAAAMGAQWVITPELFVTGYKFAEMIGTDWILPQPDDWMQTFCGQVREHGVTVFLSYPERDPEAGLMFNTVFVISPEGSIIGRHRKVKALRGPEAWSSPGDEIVPIDCDGTAVGVMICADAYRNDVAGVLKDRGAEILVSPASWGPGDCGPLGEWEQRTLDTGLPIMVCNRSGWEADDLDFNEAVSVVAVDGKRVLQAFCGEASAVLVFDWDLDAMAPVSTDYEIAWL